MSDISPQIPLRLLTNRLAVSRLPAEAEWPEWARPGDLLALVRTRQEVSLVCEERFTPPEVKSERGWRALEVLGPLDFALTGILAGLSGRLAEASVSIFAISTYDTDYILVKEIQLGRALAALRTAGYTIEA